MSLTQSTMSRFVNIQNKRRGTTGKTAQPVKSLAEGRDIAQEARLGPLFKRNRRSILGRGISAATGGNKVLLGQ